MAPFSKSLCHNNLNKSHFMFHKESCTVEGAISGASGSTSQKFSQFSAHVVTHIGLSVHKVIPVK